MDSAPLVKSMEETPVSTAPATQNMQKVQTGGLQPGSQPSSGRSSPYQTQTLHTVQPGNPSINSAQGQYNQQPPAPMVRNQAMQQQQLQHQQQIMQQQQQQQQQHQQQQQQQQQQQHHQIMQQQQQRGMQQQVVSQQGMQQPHGMQQHLQGTPQQQQYMQQQPVRQHQIQQAPRPQPPPPPPPPSQADLASFNFDPMSQAVLQSLGGRHPNSFHQVTGYVNSALREVIATAGNLELPASCQMEYDTLLDSILLPDETASDRCIAFSGVTFQHINDTKSGVEALAKPNMGQGRVYLTNQRLVLLSAEETKGLNLTGEGKVKMSAYNVKGQKTYNLRYESLPLTCFRGVDFSTAYGFSATARIQAFFPDSISQCLQPCCEDEKYRERWLPQKTLTASIDNRVINLGALLPPWETKCNIQLYMSKDTEMATALGFISALQQAAPGLQPESLSIPRQ